MILSLWPLANLQLESAPQRHGLPARKPAKRLLTKDGTNFLGESSKALHADEAPEHQSASVPRRKEIGCLIALTHLVPNRPCLQRSGGPSDETLAGTILRDPSQHTGTEDDELPLFDPWRTALHYCLPHQAYFSAEGGRLKPRQASSSVETKMHLVIPWLRWRERSTFPV